MDQLRCCELTCNAAAEYLLVDGYEPTPDDYTHACEKHVGSLLTDVPQTVVVPLGGRYARC